ncbi:hypothetical protein L1987_81335 [Smallanthus sonchifolius]|uniref:Uncharacterized protein n=1 Tax=Smallanthus sonchifolius TaxID=185202 RepID=A0ACB8YQ65_9ASTR|nr:hypothetical protein L1987_81335 [Smallanthus sonchifolius]
MARVGEVAYRLELPDELSGIHPTFHVSHLRKCLADESAHVPLTDIEVDNSLNYIEEPVAILDRKEKRLRIETRVSSGLQVSKLEVSSDLQLSKLEVSSDLQLSKLEVSSDLQLSKLEVSSDLQLSKLEVSMGLHLSKLSSFDRSASVGEDGVTTVAHGITGIPMEGTIPCGEILPMVMMMDGDAGRLEELPG